MARRYLVKYLLLFLSFFSIRRLWVLLDEKSSSEYPVNAGVAWVSILGPTLFLLYINDLHDNAMYSDDTKLYSTCCQAADLWKQVELTSELGSDLRDTVDWSKKCLVDFNAGNTQLVSFEQSYDIGAINAKMYESILEENSFFQMLGLILFFRLDWGSYMNSITKTASKKIRALIRSLKFLFPEVALYLY